MPPNGYSTVTISEETVEKLSVIMAEHDENSLAEAIEHAVSETLATEDLLDEAELAQLLYQRLQNKRKT